MSEDPLNPDTKSLEGDAKRFLRTNRVNYEKHELEWIVEEMIKDKAFARIIKSNKRLEHYHAVVNGTILKTIRTASEIDGKWLCQRDYIACKHGGCICGPICWIVTLILLVLIFLWLAIGYRLLVPYAQWLACVADVKCNPL